jgi:hypothetical protein
MKRLHLKPIAWSTYFHMASTHLYEDLAAINCVCPTCREKGFETFDAARSILDDAETHLGLVGGTVLSKDHVKELTRRLDRLERDMRSECPRAFTEENACASLCARLALGTEHAAHFRCQCEHKDKDGRVGDMPMDFDDVLKANGEGGIWKLDRHGAVVMKNGSPALDTTKWSDACHICTANDPPIESLGVDKDDQV